MFWIDHWQDVLSLEFWERFFSNGQLTQSNYYHLLCRLHYVKICLIIHIPDNLFQNQNQLPIVKENCKTLKKLQTKQSKKASLTNAGRWKINLLTGKCYTGELRSNYAKIAYWNFVMTIIQTINKCWPKMFCVSFTCFFLKINPSRPNPVRREKINLKFYFHVSLWCLKRFYEGL